jgi:hypothetical protein
MHLLELEEWEAAHHAHMPSFRPYLNATDAARRYSLLHDRLTSVPVQDVARPIVQCSASLDGFTDALAEKLELQRCFSLVSSHPGITPAMCRLWYQVRILGMSYRSVAAKGGTVGRWIRYVDLAIDEQLDRAGLLASSECRDEAERRGVA